MGTTAYLLMFSYHNDMVDVSAPWVLGAVVRNLAGGLALLCWDALLTLDSEIRHIWGKSNASPIKWLFLFIRYYGFAAQTLSLAMPLQSPLPHDTCRVWHTVQFVLVQAMMSALEIVLMVRVYALYNRSKRVAGVMTFFLVMEVITMGITAWYHIPSIHFTPTCFTTIKADVIGYYSAATLATHLVVMGLSFNKQFFSHRVAWGRTPLVQLVMRDNTLAFLFMLLLLSLIILNIAWQVDAAFLLVYWLFPLMSVTGCRLILNMHQFTTPRAPTEQLTTLFSLPGEYNTSRGSDCTSS